MESTILIPEIRELLVQNDTSALKELFESEHPVRIAEWLAEFEPEEIRQIFSLLPPYHQASILVNFDKDLQVKVVMTLNRQEASRLFTAMPHDDRADLFKLLSEEEQEELLPSLAHAEREDIRRLASYPEGSTGSVMTSDYMALPPNITAEEALNRMRREAPDKETIYYAYVIDEDRKLLGFLSLKDLILANPKKKIEDIMHREVIFSRVTDDQEETARKIQKYNLIAIPVVNGNNALVGIVTHDDALDIITQETTEDMEKFMAITGSHESSAYLKTSPLEHFKNRGVWVFILAILGLISGMIVQRYENLLSQFAVLVTFMPMLAAAGGNTGSQSATLIVRALALKEITPKDVLKILFKECQVALLLGILLGGMAFGRVLLQGGTMTIPNGYSLSLIGLAIAIALALQVLTSTLFGAILPIIAAKMKWDPAVVASPSLATIVDITGLLIYFNTASYILGI
ncbi:MAG: magnesium transporter [Candidatus Marinimicrobia bacterium]|nr:magnesium transporter [Candidatus Neomarinimicrobiota bacterium]